MKASKNFKIWAIAVLVAVTALVYSPVVKHEFLSWDDGAHLRDNLSLRGLDGQHLQDIFTSYVNDIYIPLTTLSFAIEYHFFGLNPVVYHLNNLILHILIVLLVFVIAQRLGLSAIAAFVAAMIFAIHPTRVESVAWVTERKDVLYSLFYLLAVYFYLRHLDAVQLTPKQKVSRRFLTGTEIFGVLSLLAKPMALSLPIVLLLIDWFKGRGINRRAILEKIPLFILTFLIAWATYAVQARIPGQSVSEGFLVWIWTLTFYIKQFFFPFISVPVYRLAKPVGLQNPEYILAVLIFLILIFILFKFRKNRWVVFAFGYLFASIFFLLRFDDKADINMVADRFMYLPILGACIALGFWVERGLSQMGRWKSIIVTASVIVFLAWGITAHRQAKIWRDNITLWSHELKYFPDEPIALNNLATALRDTPPYQEAEKEFVRLAPTEQKTALSDPRFEKIQHIVDLYERAGKAKSDYADASYNLGNLFRDIGMLEESRRYYADTIARDKTYKDAYFNLGGLYIIQNEPAKAIEMFNQLIALDPSREISYENIVVAYNKALQEKGPNPLYEEARSQVLKAYHQLLSQTDRDAYTYFKMGYVYQDMKNYEQAVSAYRMALEQNPDYIDALYNLANTYIEINQPLEALPLYTKIIKLKPSYAEAYLNLGVAYSQLGKVDESKKVFLKLLDISPDHADAYFNLGYIYEAEGNKEKAIEAYSLAIKNNSQHAEAYYNIGNVYAGLNMMEQAAESYQKAIEIKPSHEDAKANLSVVSALINK